MRGTVGTPNVIALIPAFNEREKVGRVVSKVPKPPVTEVIVIDDGSSDGTPDEAKAQGATVIAHPQTRGVGAALRTGIRYAQGKKADAIVVLAGNDKDNPEEIDRLLFAIFQEGYDFIQGSRYLNGGQFGQMPFYRILATRYVHPMLFSLITGRRITDSTNGFRAFRPMLFENGHLNIDQNFLDQYELEPYLYYKAIRLGYRVKEVPVTKIYPPKALGYTKMRPITGWWSILKPIVYLGLGIWK